MSTAYTEKALTLIYQLRETLKEVKITSETDNWISQLDQMERTLRRMMEAAK